MEEGNIYTYARDCQPQWDQETNAQMELSRTNSIPFSFSFFFLSSTCKFLSFRVWEWITFFVFSLSRFTEWVAHRAGRWQQPSRLTQTGSALSHPTDCWEDWRGGGGPLLLHNWTRFLFGALLPRRFDRPIFFFSNERRHWPNEEEQKVGGKKRKKRNDGKR